MLSRYTVLGPGTNTQASLELLYSSKAVHTPALACTTTPPPPPHTQHRCPHQVWLDVATQLCHNSHAIAEGWTHKCREQLYSLGTGHQPVMPLAQPNSRTTVQNRR